SFRATVLRDRRSCSGGTISTGLDLRSGRSYSDLIQEKAPRGCILRGRDTRRSVLMHANHRKRREPVVYRGQRVRNLYIRPKPSTDRREGDTFEVTYRDETGKQRQKTLRARTVQRAIVEAEEYRSKVRRGEVLPASTLTFGEVAEEFLAITA